MDFFIICIGALPLTMLVQYSRKGGREISFCRFRLFQSLQNDLLQFTAVGTLHAKNGSFDVGVQAGGALCQCLAVVDGLVAVIYGDEVEEQAGDASVEFVERMQGDQFGLVMGEAFGEFFRWPICGLFEILLLLQFAEDAFGFMFEVAARQNSEPPLLMSTVRYSPAQLYRVS